MTILKPGCKVYKEFLKPFGSPHQATIPHLPANRGGLGGEKKFTSESQREGLFGEAPHRPCLLDSWCNKAPSSAEAPLKTLRHFLFWKQNCPLYGPALPRSSSGISERQRPQQSPFYKAEQQWGQLVLCCSGGWRMQSHQITKTSAVFLLLQTITIGTTSCCCHSNRTVPSTQ